jgi:hypothetical protein
VVTCIVKQFHGVDCLTVQLEGSAGFGDARGIVYSN